MLYAYAVIPARADDDRLASIRGINLERVRLERVGALAAVLSEVPADEFEEQPLNANLADPTWLGLRAQAHQEVNAALFERFEATLPLSFGVVFRDAASVRRALEARQAAYLERLAAVRGTGEWVLRLTRDRPAVEQAVEATSPLLRQLHAEQAAAAPGRAFLLNRRLQLAREEERQRFDVEALRSVLAWLQARGWRGYREPMAEDAAQMGVLARLSVLVPRAEEAAMLATFESLRADLAERGYPLELTGPWPPYRFAGLDPAEAAVG